jgi:hypothetical protein
MMSEDKSKALTPETLQLNPHLVRRQGALQHGLDVFVGENSGHSTNSLNQQRLVANGLRDIAYGHRVAAIVFSRGRTCISLASPVVRLELRSMDITPKGKA